MNNTVFIDTSFFKAFVDENDDCHKLAIEILSSLEKERTTLLTTNFILDETITLLRFKSGIQKVKNFREALVQLTKLKIRRVLGQDETKAWSWFWNEWKKLSFTDCVSFAVMKRLGIEKVATFDEHFKKAGFETVH